jgi:hypothetical protein
MQLLLGAKAEVSVHLVGSMLLNPTQYLVDYYAAMLLG